MQLKKHGGVAAEAEYANINCMYVDDALECAGGEFLSNKQMLFVKSIF